MDVGRCGPRLASIRARVQPSSQFTVTEVLRYARHAQVGLQIVKMLATDEVSRSDLVRRIGHVRI